MIRRVLFVAGLLAAFAVTPPWAQAASIDVNSAADPPSADDGQCTLREAVQAAGTNAAPGTMLGECAAGDPAPTLDRILLDPGVTYGLAQVGSAEDGNASGDLDVNGLGPVAIEGSGSPASTIDANDLDRAIHALDTGDALSVDGVRITDGNAPNGNGQEGGGVSVAFAASLTLTDSTIDQNLAGGGAGVAFSGGIHVEGTLQMSSSVVADNDATSTNSVATGGGVGIGANATVAIADSVIAANAVTTNVMGAINGGGINNANGDVTVRRSSISGNSLDNPSSPGSQRGAGAMMGLGVTASSFTLLNSTVSGNSLVGGGSGAGLQVNGTAPVKLIHSTVAANGPTGGGDAINAENAGTDVTVRGSVLSGPDPADVCSLTSGAGPLTSADHNVGLGTSCGLTMASDAQGVDPMLGALGPNGGPLVGAPGFQQTLQTHAVSPGTAPLDRVPPASCLDELGGPLSVDERGVSRPQGAACESGAFELAPAPPAGLAEPPAVAKKKKCKKKKRKKKGKGKAAAGAAKKKKCKKKKKRR